ITGASEAVVRACAVHAEPSLMRHISRNSRSIERHGELQELAVGWQLALARIIRRQIRKR
ncbi:hypothetical protein, partial [Streptomyces sp. NRRL F-2799]|uniref:hypothetical protein n=1 Tax=Streptomyces sp. NRRL F-2799 TaxID=1463844 RepID=UPI001F224234